MKTWKLGMLLLLLSFGLGACDDDEKNGLEDNGNSGTVAELAVTGFGYEAKTVLKNTGRLAIPVVLDKKAAAIVKVTVGVKASTTENAAREGMDFNIEEKVVNIPVGDTVGFVNVDILDNKEADGDREFEVVLTGVFGGGKANTTKQNCRISVVSNSFVEFEKAGWVMYESSASEQAKPEWQNSRFVPLVITGEITEASTIVLGVRDNTASEYIHFELKDHEVSVQPGDKRVMVEVLPVDDDEANDDRDFELYIKEIRGGNLTVGKNNLSSKVTIISEEVRKTVSFESVTVVKVADDVRELLIPVIIDKIPDSDVKVRVAASSLSTAGADVDYVIETPEVVIDQTRRAEIKVRILGNNEVDADRQLILQLRSAEGDNAFLSETESALTVDIVNNDFPAFEAATLEVEEDSESKLQITIPAVNRERQMKFEIESGSKYFTVASVSVTIPAGANIAELPVKISYDLDFPSTAEEAVIRLTEVDGFVMPEPVETTLKMVECQYRKMLGTWDLSCTPDNCNPTCVVTVKGGRNEEEILKNWNKKLVCEAANLISGFTLWYYINWNNGAPWLMLLEKAYDTPLGFGSAELSNCTVRLTWSQDANKTVVRHDLTFDATNMILNWNNVKVGGGLYQNDGPNVNGWWWFQSNTKMTKRKD